MDTVPECLECGCCCFSRSPEYLRVMGVDHERLGDDADRLVEFRGHRAYMKMVEGHCVALTYQPDVGHYACSIYAHRPDVCRWLERGSSHCRAERIEKRDRPLQLSVLRPNREGKGSASTGE